MDEEKFVTRSVGLQTIIPFREQRNPKISASFPLEELDYPKFALVPKTFSSLIVACAVVLLCATFTAYDGKNVFLGKIPQEYEQDIFDQIRLWFKLGLAFVVILGVSHFPDSIMRRPHPIFWRFLFSVAVFYEIVILFFSTLTRDDARYMLKIFDSKLNVPITYKSYADNCSLASSSFPYFNTAPLTDSLDIYIVAHLAGWFIKYLAIRNIWFATFLSLLFELLELTFSHWLPNFNECWWDQLILDFLGMNLLGIYFGYYICQYFEMKNYKWMINTKDDKGQNIELTQKSFFKCFFPSHVIKYEWGFLSSFKNFLGVLWFIIIFNLCDLSHFFNKFILWLPITHYTLAIRIFMWGFLCIMAIREFYEYISEPNCKVIGPFCWLSHLILFTEWVIVFKFGQGMFTEPFPNLVVYCWTSAFVILGFVGATLVINDLRKWLAKPKSPIVNRHDVTIDWK